VGTFEGFQYSLVPENDIVDQVGVCYSCLKGFSEYRVVEDFVVGHV